MIHIHTIPHSGTRFVSRFFYSLGFKDIKFATQPVLDTAEYFEVQHFHTYEVVNEKLPPITVMALRDPCLVAISHLRDDLVNEWKGMDLERLINMYNTVIMKAATRKFIYFDCHSYSSPEL